MRRVIAALAVFAVVGLGAFALAAAQEDGTKSPRDSEGTTRGTEEMRRFCTSDQMPAAMNGMMEMARQMGNGDAMAGMVRMMEMMGGMGQMGEMMGPGQPQPQ